MNTIIALATPYGTGAVSIIRLSGENSLGIAKKFFYSDSLDYDNILPRYMYLGNFHDTFDEKCFLVYFKAPNSYTGEDMVEFQCHGGMRIVKAVINSLMSAGAVMASKGEFTKRAFLNGKFALNEAEGIANMINAESISALNAGYSLMNGKLTDKIKVLNNTILDVCAQLEASLDYPEELEEEAKLNAVSALSELHIDLKELLSTANIGRVIKNGINVAIIGRPNVGKSSLLNAITSTNRAIVTDIPGTTRDIIEERVEYRDIIINFIDTAGLRETDDAIELIGIDKATERADHCDLVIILLEANRTPSEEDISIIEKYKYKNPIVVYNKSDLGVLPSNKDKLLISVKNDDNISLLLDKIASRYEKGDIDSSGAILTEARHIQSIATALDYIKSANYSSDEAPIECLLIDLKAAYYALGEITGETANEDIIDRVFEKFCLGK